MFLLSGSALYTYIYIYYIYIYLYIYIYIYIQKRTVTNKSQKSLSLLSAYAGITGSELYDLTWGDSMVGNDFGTPEDGASEVCFDSSDSCQYLDNTDGPTKGRTSLKDQASQRMDISEPSQD